MVIDWICLYVMSRIKATDLGYTFRTCPRSFCMSIFTCCMFMLQISAACPWCLSMLHGHVFMLHGHVSMLHGNADCACCVSILLNRAACPCCLSILHVHATCPCLCFMAMPMPHVHIHAACPCINAACPKPCCMSISTCCMSMLCFMLNVHAAYPVLLVNIACQYCLSMHHVHAAWPCFHAAWPCFHAAWQCCMSMLYVHAAF